MEIKNFVRKKSEKMAISIIILVGYEKARHLFGIKELTKLGINSVYIFYDKIHEGYKEIATPTAHDIKESISTFFNVQTIGCDPRDFVSVVRELTYVMKKEEPSELFIDVTNFTKESYLASSAFAILFGAKMYYVAPEEYIPIGVRIKRVFQALRDDSDIVRKFHEIISLKKEKEQEEERLIDDFLSLIEEKYTKKVKDVYEGRKPKEVKEIPLTLGKVIELTDDHEKILLTLLKKKHVETITELTQCLGMVERKDMAKIGYRIRQLEEWGFVKAERTRKTEISLSEFGQGYSEGLEKYLQEKLQREEKLKRVKIKTG